MVRMGVGANCHCQFINAGICQIPQHCFTLIVLTGIDQHTFLPTFNQDGFSLTDIDKVNPDLLSDWWVEHQIFIGRTAAQLLTDLAGHLTDRLESAHKAVFQVSQAFLPAHLSKPIEQNNDQIRTDQYRTGKNKCPVIPFFSTAGFPLCTAFPAHAAASFSRR